MKILCKFFLAINFFSFLVLQGLFGYIVDEKISPAKKFKVIREMDKNQSSMKLFDYETGILLEEFPNSFNIEFSRDDQYFCLWVLEGNRVELYDCNFNRLMFFEEVHHVMFSLDNKKILVIHIPCEYPVDLIDINPLSTVRKYTPICWSGGLEFSPDFKYQVSVPSGVDKGRICDAGSGEKLVDLGKDIFYVEFNSNGTKMLVFYKTQKGHRIYNMNTLSVIRTFNGGSESAWFWDKC